MLFVQGARAILLRPKSWIKHSFGPWLTTAVRRLHRNILTIIAARQQASADRFVCLDPRPQLRNAHRTGSRIIEQSGVYRGRPTWIANVNEPGLCNSRRGLRVGWRRWRNGLTVASVIWWHIRPSRA